MKKIVLLSFITMLATAGMAQTIEVKLANAITTCEADAQMRPGTISLSVTDALTGKPVYEHNAQLGLAAASTQKLFTSVASFELLGSKYRYKTVLGYDGKIENGILQGNLHINGYGDPTLGSWRWSD